MLPTFYRLSGLLGQMLATVPIGTDLSLYYLFIALMSGRFLSTRGAVLPAVSDMGLAADAVRRVAAALEYGRFGIEELLVAWRNLVASEGRFVAHDHMSVRPVACDLIGFFRPRLAGNTGKHYHSHAGKALPAIVIGVVASVGSARRMRLALPRLLLRAKPGETDQALSRRLIGVAATHIEAGEALICDAGFALSWLLAAKPAGFVVRLKSNCTARRNFLPDYKGRGRRPEYGDLVRPTPGKYKDKVLPATPPDSVARWKEGNRWVEASVYENVVPASERPGAASFRLVVIHHPRYKQPLILATNLKVTAYDLRRLYQDRWPIEQLPLAAKQMLGAHRSFVFGEESRWRLPELALLAGSVLSYLAATTDAVATGFWDRRPRPTCGRLRRVLSGIDFSKLPPPHGMGSRLRKKASATSHLKTGIDAHRRSKSDVHRLRAA